MSTNSSDVTQQSEYKPRRPWPWGPGPKPAEMSVKSSITQLPSLNDVSFAEFMNGQFEKNFSSVFSLSASDEATSGDKILDHILKSFDISENQKKSLEESNISIIHSLENELEYIYKCKSIGYDINFSSLGLNPENCPGLPLESILVRRETTFVDGMPKASSKIILLRGHLPVKPDKPDKPPREPRPTPTPGPGRGG
ncbi:hypothetical protein [Methylobacterium sp. Leaf91]|uniref:hypothetical protein n=1 Tax=Methylobacterium sp. Leaf91 TaxID=1736247 RepID=UPI0012E8EF63|nr:hypothetical protein [Methylobacterium sp. Leaf91]